MRTLPAGTEAFISAQASGIVPVLLVDIQTNDGTQYFWTDVEGNYTSKLNGTSQFYAGWVKKGFTFTRTRDLASDAGDLTVQNLSGNSIVRDVASALAAREFTGGLCIVRLWIPLLDQSIDEFGCVLSEPQVTEEDCTFRLLQLFDPSQYFAVSDVVSEVCDLTGSFKGVRCGSTGSAASCDGLFTTCQDATHLAQERFNGVLYVIPSNNTKPPRDTGGGVITDAAAGGRRPPGVGPGRNLL